MTSSTENSFQMSGHEARQLSEQELSKLMADVNVVSDFKQNKLELEAQKNWDLFYKRNTTKFFKDRHWTTREFEELTSSSLRDKNSKQIVFEVGCGVGNFMFPLLDEDPNLHFYACDFSPRAVEFVKSHPAYDASRVTAFQCDITRDFIASTVPEGSVDIATLIFVLSAIHPDKMSEAVNNVVKTLKPGGVLLVRDYGLYDHAMLRFSKGHKLADCFYVRQDGTRAYYFSLEKLDSIMKEAGLKTLESSYIQRSTVNKKEGVDVQRIFVQGKYLKLDSVGCAGDSNSSEVDNSVTHTHVPSQNSCGDDFPTENTTGETSCDIKDSAHPSQVTCSDSSSTRIVTYAEDCVGNDSGSYFDSTASKADKQGCS